MEFNRFFSVFLLVALSFLLAACGGGGGGGAGSGNSSSTGSSSNSVSVGYFTDSVVEGLSYATATESGLTNSEGRFTYLAGEVIAFSVGGLVLGEAPAAPVMTVLDLVPDAELPTTTGQIAQLYDFFIEFSAQPAFNKLHNILSLLHTLDQDNNPDNGIKIAVGVGALFSGAAVDLSQNLLDFEDDRGLSLITHQAVVDGLIVTAQVKPYGIALQYFYRTRNISTAFGVPESIDGSTTYVYDDNGNEVRYQNGSNLYTSAYDDNSNLLVDTYTPPVGAGYVFSYNYDSNGDLIEVVIDADADGNTDKIYTYSYNPNGTSLFFNIDLGADGSIDEKTTITHDVNGNWVTGSIDTNGDARPERIETFTYNSNGQVLTFENDTNADGIADLVRNYTYDAEGNRLSRSEDSDGDGNFDSIRTYTYDDYGNRVTESVGDGGSVNEVTTRIFDGPKHNLLELRKDSNGDGSLDRIILYAYSDEELLLTRSTDSDADGVANTIDIYTYDDRGNLLTEGLDSDADGIVDSVVNYVTQQAHLRALLYWLSD